MTSEHNRYQEAKALVRSFQERIKRYSGNGQRILYYIDGKHEVVYEYDFRRKRAYRSKNVLRYPKLSPKLAGYLEEDANEIFEMLHRDQAEKKQRKKQRQPKTAKSIQKRLL